jgi:hypothetical protein
MSNAKVSARIARTVVTLYLADRSPTGHAVARLATLGEDGVRRAKLLDFTPTLDVAVSPREALYATPEAAKAAARRRWFCVA